MLNSKTTQRPTQFYSLLSYQLPLMLFGSARAPHSCWMITVHLQRSLVSPSPSCFLATYGLWDLLLSVRYFDMQRWFQSRLKRFLPFILTYFDFTLPSRFSRGDRQLLSNWGSSPISSYVQIGTSKLPPAPPKLGQLFPWSFKMITRKIECLRGSAEQQTIWCDVLDAVLSTLYPGIYWALVCEIGCNVKDCNQLSHSN